MSNFLAVNELEQAKLPTAPRQQEGVMPTYEYRCEGCKKGFEVRLTITERTKAHVACPACGSKKVRPQLTVFTPKTC